MLDAGGDDDWLIGGPGNDKLQGRNGVDVVLLSGLLEDYLVQFNSSNNSYRVTANVPTCLICPMTIHLCCVTTLWQMMTLNTFTRGARPRIFHLGCHGCDAAQPLPFPAPLKGAGAPYHRV